ncbi:MAG: hypothetical protein HKP48_05340 [Winogradskyella sp.]|uniref:hypothetical protein n=1 Tax=Winogradskyella sp. TaxID=1883156 RepID=UPI0017F9B3A9|nr:hypothetical protein [Winogradskyella sp.]MBT8244327.1 hypothetical protein [Winogradskyella sp.]NNK22722.1 hypothetical protein [Winogradskyella sp.]
MKPTDTDNISCIIFGHNFYKSLDEVNGNTQLKCKHCCTTLDIDDFGNSHHTEAVDKTFKNALRRLFLLKRNVA